MDETENKTIEDKTIEYKTKESHHTKEHHKKDEQPNTKFIVMAVIVGILIVFSVMQSYEIANLKKELNTQLSTLSVVGKNPTTAQPGSNLKKNLQNLPSMVGGC